MREYKLTDVAVSRLALMVWFQNSPRNQHESVHRHDCIEMMYVVNGAGICYVNGKPYPATRGDLFVMSHQDTHEFIAEQKFVYYNIMFSRDLFTAEELERLQHFPNFDDWMKSGAMVKRYQFMPPHCDELETQIGKVTAEFRYRAEGFELNAKASFMQFLVYLLRHLAYLRLHRGESTHESAVARAIYYINLHYHDALTLRVLAREAGVSESTLSKIFKRETGDAVFDYIGRVRIGKAQFELEHTGKSISQIAGELGYYDSSYFSRAFRRYVGTSPRVYRNRVVGHVKNT